MRRLTHTTRSERGAVTAITAIAIVALLGAAALAIDVGVGWHTRRNLVTTTDAAALAAAQSYASGVAGCPTVASQWVTSNQPTATMTACDPAVNGGAGTVTVDAEETIGTFFAKAIGLNSIDTDSSSTAEWGAPISATGLRPFGLCADADPIQAFLADPDTTQTHVISYTKDDPNECGGNDVPGNWGTIDFDFGSNSNADTKDWILNGYQGPVNTGTPTGDCTTEAYACYPGDTGATTGVKNETQWLADSGIYFGLPIYNVATLNGANAEYHIIAFVRVRIIDFKFNGAETVRFIELEFSPGLITGTCCNPSGPPSNAKVVSLCDVDRKNLGGC